MMDPMANIAAPQTSGGQPGQADDQQEVFDYHAQQSNVQKMEAIRSYMGIVTGICAGILGLTNMNGILFFFAGQVIVSLALYMKMGGDIEKYYKGIGKISFALDGVQNCFMSYMLFWTLFYGLVYLFE